MNVPLLVMRPSVAEQRLWRRFRVQQARRWLTRARDAGKGHGREGIVAVAKRNILWHLVLTLVIALLVLHPALTSLRYRGAVYAFAVAGCLAYVAGSVVQRQKIVVLANRRACTRTETTTEESCGGGGDP
ncbi:MAG TPA: hypothetical protein VEO54_22375 [Thermoanaerobaculia bacterium]|nr:hypothetical protein [Thermoanaerobaculia bacterium]